MCRTVHFQRHGERLELIKRGAVEESDAENTGSIERTAVENIENEKPNRNGCRAYKACDNALSVYVGDPS